MRLRASPMRQLQQATRRRGVSCNAGQVSRSRRAAKIVWRPLFRLATRAIVTSISLGLADAALIAHPGALEVLRSVAKR
jgi:hypothetical protein